MKQTDYDDWKIIGLVFVLGLLVDFLKSVGNGAALTPAQVFLRLLSRSAFTGAVAAGMWTAITTWKPEINPTFGVAVAAGVAMLGTEFIALLLSKRLQWGAAK